jgi:hypothetical protein
MISLYQKLAEVEKVFRLPTIITNYDTPLDNAFSTARAKRKFFEELLILLIYNRNEVQILTLATFK